MSISTHHTSTEKSTQRAVLDYLDHVGAFYYRQNSGAVKVRGHFYRMVSRNGAPDIVVVHKGKYIGLEIKDINGKLNKDQIRFKHDLEKAGGEYHVIRSLEEVRKFI